MYRIADFDNLAALEAWQKKLGADPGYRALTKKASDIVIDGTVEDTILEPLRQLKGRYKEEPLLGFPVAPHPHRAEGQEKPSSDGELPQVYPVTPIPEPGYHT